MRLIRQILSDRVLATAMAVVIAYMLVLQGLTGGYARASTISPAENPFHVICASAGTMDVAPENRSAPFTKKAECPCALLCRLANSTIPAVLGSVALTVATVGTIDHQTVAGPEKSPRHQPRRLIAEPRAPPRIS